MHPLQAINQYLNENGVLAKYWTGTADKMTPPHITAGRNVAEADLWGFLSSSVKVSIVDGDFKVLTMTMTNTVEDGKDGNWYCQSAYSIPMADPDALPRLLESVKYQANLTHKQHSELVTAERLARIKARADASHE